MGEAAGLQGGPPERTLKKGIEADQGVPRPTTDLLAVVKGIHLSSNLHLLLLLERLATNREEEELLLQAVSISLHRRLAPVPSERHHPLRRLQRKMVNPRILHLQ